jgi:N-dimethylarginine dimethylaminohydrolase
MQLQGCLSYCKHNATARRQHFMTKNSMVSPLKKVLVCTPQAAGWDSPEASNWKHLGFVHPANVSAAQAQHDELCRQLREAGAEVVSLPTCDTLSLDAVYTHDSSLNTDQGLVILNPGKQNRVPESAAHRKVAEQLGLAIAGEIKLPGTAEAGDMVWLDDKTLLIGRGFRTNSEGIAQMRELLPGVKVVSAPLPYGVGPSACLHLMSLMSLLDEKAILVDLPGLAVETVQLLQARGYSLVEIDYSERDTLACNVLALGNNRLLAIEENVKTNQKLREAGFDVRTFPGSELGINGGGGPTCLTRPLVRE